MTSARVVLAASLLACVLAAPAHAGWLSVSATAASPTQIAVAWGYAEDPAFPVHAEWAGFDLYRRSAADCGPWVRLTADPIPRLAGQSQQGTLLDTPPAGATQYQYDLWMVDAQRVRMYPAFPACEPPCPPPAFASCPGLSAPAILGTVDDWGWAVLLTSCAGSCPGQCYVENPVAEQLRPYAGTGQVVRAYGALTCGTVEGCALHLDHFELARCLVTPVRRATWGRLKSLYR